MLHAQKPLITTTAVLTELLYFLHADQRRTSSVWRLFSSGILKLASIEQVDLPALEGLMRRYADRPMDFADATLVHVASREGIADILTIDHDDFEAYRFGRNRKFRIQPSR